MSIESQPTTDTNITPAETPAKHVNWKQVGAFLGLTFGLTWLLDLALFLNGGLKSPAALISLQFQMLLPAFSAILLGMFFFKDSLINVKNNHSKSRWFTWYYLVFTLIYAIATILVFFRPDQIQIIMSVMLLPSVIGMILVIVLRVSGRKRHICRCGHGGRQSQTVVPVWSGNHSICGIANFIELAIQNGETG